MLSGRSSSRTRLMRVVFPAPDGPETMNKVPSGWKLLDILYLFADALDLGLQFYNHGPDRRRARLRAHGVDLAQHLLGEEVELLAGGFARADGLLDLVEMMREPRELLGDVALFDHDYVFLFFSFLCCANVDLHSFPTRGSYDRRGCAARASSRPDRE